MSHYSCSRREGRRGKVLIACKSTALTPPSRSQWKMSDIWFDILRWSLLRDILSMCVLSHDVRFVLRIKLEISVLGTAAWRNILQDLVFLFIFLDLSGLYTDERPRRWQNSHRLWQYIWWKVQGRSCHNFWDEMGFFIYIFIYDLISHAWHCPKSRS